MNLEHLCATGRAARAHACRASDHSCQPAAASSAAASERRKPCVASEGSLFAAHGGFLFLFSFPRPFCACHEADRLDQKEGEGAEEGDREAERVRARACARLLEHLVSVSAATLSSRKGGETG